MPTWAVERMAGEEEKARCAFLARRTLWSRVGAGEAAAKECGVEERVLKVADNEVC